MDCASVSSTAPTAPAHSASSSASDAPLCRPCSCAITSTAAARSAGAGAGAGSKALAPAAREVLAAVQLAQLLLAQRLGAGVDGLHRGRAQAVRARRAALAQHPARVHRGADPLARLARRDQQHIDARAAVWRRLP